MHSTPQAPPITSSCNTSTTCTNPLVKSNDVSASTVCIITSSDDDEDCEPASPSLLSPNYDNPVKKYKVDESNTSLAKDHELSSMVDIDADKASFPQAPTLSGDSTTGMVFTSLKIYTYSAL